MKAKLLSVILLAAILAGCAATPQQANLLYGIGDDELNLLGRRLGFRVEALGMSDYSFTRGSCVFHVWAHNEIPVGSRLRADAPLTLNYQPSRSVSLGAANRWNLDAHGWQPLSTAVAGGEVRALRSRLLLDGGVTLRAVEFHFRHFVSEIQSFEKHLQSPN